MKRPLPSTITTPGAASILAMVLLVLLRLSYVKYDRVRCPTVLTAALIFDSDCSGGLDKLEFSKFVYGLDGVAITDAKASGNVSVSSLSKLVSDAYDHLLCQCHYTFGQDRFLSTSSSRSCASSSTHPRHWMRWILSSLALTTSPNMVRS